MTKVTEGSTAPTQNTEYSMVAELDKSITEGLCLKQPIFNWAAKDNYTELKQFEMEVTNIFIIPHCDISDVEVVPKIKKWQGRQGTQLIQTLTQAEQHSCKTVNGLCKILDAEVFHLGGCLEMAGHSVVPLMIDC